MALALGHSQALGIAAIGVDRLMAATNVIVMSSNGVYNQINSLIEFQWKIVLFFVNTDGR